MSPTEKLQRAINDAVRVAFLQGGTECGPSTMEYIERRERAETAWNRDSQNIRTALTPRVSRYIAESTQSTGANLAQPNQQKATEVRRNMISDPSFVPDVGLWWIDVRNIGKCMASVYALDDDKVKVSVVYPSIANHISSTDCNDPQIKAWLGRANEEPILQ